jgi:hypothetical protein
MGKAPPAKGSKQDK